MKISEKLIYFINEKLFINAKAFHKQISEEVTLKIIQNYNCTTFANCSN